MRIEAEKYEPLKKNKKPFAYERDVVQVETITDEKKIGAYSSLVSFSRKPLANGLLTIFNCVTCRKKRQIQNIQNWKEFQKCWLSQPKCRSVGVGNPLMAFIWRILRSIWLLFLIFRVNCRHNLTLDRGIDSINQARVRRFIEFFEASSSKRLRNEACWYFFWYANRT